MAKIESTILREFIAELLGTFVLVTLGCCGNAYATVSQLGNMSHTVGPWAWGMGLTAAIFVCGGVSGGHVNPAVSIGMASIGKLPWFKLPHYIAGQFIGAFFGAVVTLAVYSHALTSKFGGFYVEGKNGTANIFGTFPTADTPLGICFLDQVVACMFFLLLINAITDKKNMAVPSGLVPIAIGITDLGLLIFTFGFNCGGPINPARDFSPRVASALFGYGGTVFTAGNSFFWVPLVACPLGGMIGSWIYKLAIEMHWPQKDNSEEKKSATYYLDDDFKKNMTFNDFNDVILTSVSRSFYL